MPPAVRREELRWDTRWEERDVLLYALSVGAGQGAGDGELRFTVEDVAEHPLQVLPTFAASLFYPGTEAALADLDWTDVLFAEHRLRLAGPLPTAAEVHARSAVSAVHDQGSGALVVVEASADDAATGAEVARTTTAMFVRGAGGFGGTKAPSPAWAAPDRAPDVALAYDVRPDQALLYRLNGDRNPLHADPAFAARAGFDAPILHGLCTYGIAVRLLLHAFAGGDPARVVETACRFTSPVRLGERLTTEAWRDGDELAFLVRGGDGRVVLTRGQVRLTPAAS